ncbi:hypothetical protein DFP72DRAFT_1091147 [Ephemerocybe angulata]|uniref:Uncharacterized protein n=1 Tax=Ephemerocybe angulata TaxID=980116 RepID=A0A8H6HEP0_9AGAR|nr:hypothetical protein DFP72DRAFT_1091147 [Tulosesus angulatus]
MDVNANFAFPGPSRPPPSAFSGGTNLNTTGRPRLRPAKPGTSGSAGPRESNALRASVLDVAMELGITSGNGVAEWMFSNIVVEEEEVEGGSVPSPGLTHSTSTDSHTSSPHVPLTPPTAPRQGWGYPASANSNNVYYHTTPMRKASGAASEGSHEGAYLSTDPFASTSSGLGAGVVPFPSSNGGSPTDVARPTTPSKKPKKSLLKRTKSKEKEDGGDESDGGYLSSSDRKRERTLSTKEEKARAKEEKARAKEESKREKEEERKRKKSLGALAKSIKRKDKDKDTSSKHSKETGEKEKDVGRAERDAITPWEHGESLTSGGGYETDSHSHSHPPSSFTPKSKSKSKKKPKSSPAEEGGYDTDAGYQSAGTPLKKSKTSRFFGLKSSKSASNLRDKEKEKEEKEREDGPPRLPMPVMPLPIASRFATSFGEAAGSAAATSNNSPSGNLSLASSPSGSNAKLNFPTSNSNSNSNSNSGYDAHNRDHNHNLPTTTATSSSSGAGGLARPPIPAFDTSNNVPRASPPRAGLTLDTDAGAFMDSAFTSASTTFTSSTATTSATAYTSATGPFSGPSTATFSPPPPSQSQVLRSPPPQIQTQTQILQGREQGREQDRTSKSSAETSTSSSSSMSSNARRRGLQFSPTRERGESGWGAPTSTAGIVGGSGSGSMGGSMMNGSVSGSVGGNGSIVGHGAGHVGGASVSTVNTVSTTNTVASSAHVGYAPSAFSAPAGFPTSSGTSFSSTTSSFSPSHNFFSPSPDTTSFSPNSSMQNSTPFSPTSQNSTSNPNPIPTSTSASTPFAPSSPPRELHPSGPKSPSSPPPVKYTNTHLKPGGLKPPSISLPLGRTVSPTVSGSGVGVGSPVSPVSPLVVEKRGAFSPLLPSQQQGQGQGQPHGQPQYSQQQQRPGVERHQSQRGTSPLPPTSPYRALSPGLTSPTMGLGATMGPGSRGASPVPPRGVSPVPPPQRGGVNGGLMSPPLSSGRLSPNTLPQSGGRVSPMRRRAPANLTIPHEGYNAHTGDEDGEGRGEGREKGEGRGGGMLPSPNVLAYYDIPPPSPPPVGPLPSVPPPPSPVPQAGGGLGGVGVGGGGLGGMGLGGAGGGGALRSRVVELQRQVPELSVLRGVTPELRGPTPDLRDAREGESRGAVQILRGRESPFPTRPVVAQVPRAPQYGFGLSGVNGSRREQDVKRTKSGKRVRIREGDSYIGGLAYDRMSGAAGSEEGYGYEEGDAYAYGEDGDGEDVGEYGDVLQRFVGSEDSHGRRSGEGSSEGHGGAALGRMRSFEALRERTERGAVGSGYGWEGEEDGAKNRESRWSGSIYSRVSILDPDQSEEARDRFVRRVEAMMRGADGSSEGGHGSAEGRPSGEGERGYVPPVPKIPEGLVNSGAWNRF